jgi:hypothetical protein
MTVEGAPRVLATDVREADWDSGGVNLAVVRSLGTADRLEYPVGKTLIEANGYLSDPRVCHRMARVWPSWRIRIAYDDRGYVKVVDTSGRVTHACR